VFKLLKPTKDAYISNRVIDNVLQLSSNTGAASTLDLYKLYGYSTTLSGSTSTLNTELTRLLVKFDLTPLKNLVSRGLVDTNNPTFSCYMRLFDVYGGQPTPSNFSMIVCPLSSTFDEGLGTDVVTYGDSDTCNFLTASAASGPWIGLGCTNSGSAQDMCDFITASALINNGASLISRQTFVSGFEDLDIDVTTVVSATIAGLLPDNGFRISLDPTLEQDNHSYFVKRFGSRTVFVDSLRPFLYARYDDSVQDDTSCLSVDTQNTLFLYNYSKSVPANILSGSTHVTGTSCIVLELSAPVSGGLYAAYFTGSQHYSGINPQTGIYSASVLLSSADSALQSLMAQSSSVMLTPTWRSLDGAVTYSTGNKIALRPPQRGPVVFDPWNLVVSVLGLNKSHNADEDVLLRVHAFDYTSPYVTAVKLPVEFPGVVMHDVYYQVRDCDSGKAVIPFDDITNSTRVSNDASSMFFKLDMSNLLQGHSYVIDIKVVSGNMSKVFKSASPAFTVYDLR